MYSMAYSEVMLPDFYSSAPSSSSNSESAAVERKGRVRKTASDVLRRRNLIRLAARRIKLAKRTVAMRDVRMQIDKEFESRVAENAKTMSRLHEANQALKAEHAEVFNKCSSLLSAVQSLSSALSHSVPSHCDWAVPRSGSESPSEDFYEDSLFYSNSQFLKPHLSSKSC